MDTVTTCLIQRVDLLVDISCEANTPLNQGLLVLHTKWTYMYNTEKTANASTIVCSVSYLYIF